MFFWSEAIVRRGKVEKSRRKLAHPRPFINVTECEEKFFNYDRNSEKSADMCRPAEPVGQFENCLRKSF